MSVPSALGALLQSFFVDHLITVKGLRPASVRPYARLVQGVALAGRGL